MGPQSFKRPQATGGVLHVIPAQDKLASGLETWFGHEVLHPDCAVKKHGVSTPHANAISHF